jgi:hypothetical protein
MNKYSKAAWLFLEITALVLMAVSHARQVSPLENGLVDGWSLVWTVPVTLLIIAALAVELTEKEDDKEYTFSEAFRFTGVIYIAFVLLLTRNILQLRAGGDIVSFWLTVLVTLFFFVASILTTCRTWEIFQQRPRRQRRPRGFR